MAEFTNEDFLAALRAAQDGARDAGPGDFAEWKQEQLYKSRSGGKQSSLSHIAPGFGLMGHLNTSSRAPTGPKARPGGNPAVGYKGGASEPWFGSTPDQQFGVPAGTEAPRPSQYDFARPNQPPPWIDDVNMASLWYSPMEPVWPFGPPYYTTPRDWNFPVGYNLNFIQNRMELMGMLRGMRQSWGVLATVIETRKDQLLRLPWTIQVRGKPRASSKFVDQVRAFFRRPDRKLSYSQWTRKYLDDLFVIDAPTIFKDRNMGGGIHKARVLDGGTIFPLIDDIGQRPDTDYTINQSGVLYEHRQPAYQQIVYGLPMVNMSEDEIIYGMMRPRPELPVFGFSQVEQILTEATEAIRKTVYQTEFWRSGSMPELIVSVPETWCYSEDTDVLTRRGWLKFSEVSVETDEFATRNPKTKVFEWQKAEGLNLSYYEGDMVSLQSRTIDCLVNPPHRVLVGDPRFGVEKIVQAGDLLHYHPGSERIPVNSSWLSGEEIRVKPFIQETSRGGGQDLYMNGDDFCAFMGAWLSDGHISGRGAAITQTENGRAYEPIQTLFRIITGTEPVKTKDGFVIYNAALVRYLEQFSTAVNKFIPPDIMNAPQRQIAIFLKFFFMCDGSATQNVLYTSSKKMADQLQELVQKIGLSASIGMDDRRGRIIGFGDHIGITNSINYRVNISTSAYRKFSVTTVPYKGQIGCVSVPNGILYVRRNGKPCWSGNSPRQIATYQAHFDALLSGQLTLKSKVRFVPGGMKPFDIKNASGESLWSQRDELLVRLCCYAFSVSPTPFVHQTNRATANQAQEASEEEGLYPLMSYWKDDVMDALIQDGFGFDDVEFTFLPRSTPDQVKQASIHQTQIDEGLRTRNDCRGELGLEPIEGGDVMTVKMGNAVVTLEQILSGEALVPGAPAPPDDPKPAKEAPPSGHSNSPVKGSPAPRNVTTAKPTPVHKLSAVGLEQAEGEAEKDPPKLKRKTGNYRKGHISLHGLAISIENAKGNRRGEKDRFGREIGVKMPAAYGYIRGTMGADNMQVDCYVGKHLDSDKVWVIDQDKFSADGEDRGFDEHKVMLGYRKPAKAVKDYKKSHFDGRGLDRLSAITEVTYSDLKRWLKKGDMKRPISEQGVGHVIGRRGVGQGIGKADTISQGTGLLSYDQLTPSAAKLRRKRKKLKRGPRWLSLVA